MAVSAADHLATYGVTVDQAYAFLIANLGNPELIFNVCLSFQVTSAMLSEIVGVSVEVVEGFFDANGLDGSALHADEEPAGEGLAFVPEALSPLAGLWALNTQESGVLTNAALRESIVTTYGQEWYDQAFNPAAYAGAADGTFSTADLGFTHLGALPATQATLESLFFGTAINLFRRVDTAEDNAISLASEAEFAAVIADAYADPATAEERRIPDEEMPTVCASITFFVGNSLTESLFDGLIDYYWY